MDEVKTLRADLNNETHTQAILEITNSYAMSEFATLTPLTDETKEKLISQLQNFSNSRIFLAQQGEEFVGVGNCFLGFSTFRAAPTLNIHDLAVLPTHRNLGIGGKLLSAIADFAKSEGCCKLTLEVRSDNDRARHLYEKHGFESELPDGVDMLYLSKSMK